jgi:hypothetical protein
LFEQTILDSIQFALDIEAEAEKEIFEINGTIGMYRIKQERIEAVWSDNEYAYRLSGLIDAEQALMVAYSTK